MITNSQSGTSVHEIAAGIFRISTPLRTARWFSFNQYLIVDDEPLLFHTGQRRLFPLVSEAIARVLPLERLKYVGLSHFEADECGALNQFLAAAPQAAPVCGSIAAATAINDFADRRAHTLQDGQELSLGHHVMRWFDTPHMPHSWECGLIMDMTTKTFFCGDLFTQDGPGEVALTESDILDRSETLRQSLDYYAHAPQTRSMLERLACENPATLACMHGSAWRGDGGALLRELGARIAATTPGS